MTPPPEQIAAMKRGGCLTGMAPAFTALLAFVLIEAFASRYAALWFSAGFIVAALVAFWEAARNRHLLEKDRDDG